MKKPNSTIVLEKRVGPGPYDARIDETIALRRAEKAAASDSQRKKETLRHVDLERKEAA